MKIIKYANVNVKIIASGEKIIVGCICENNNYLKSIADTTVTGSEKFIIIIDNLTAKRQIL